MKSGGGGRWWGDPFLTFGILIGFLIIEGIATDLHFEKKRRQTLLLFLLFVIPLPSLRRSFPFLTDSLMNHPRTSGWDLEGLRARKNQAVWVDSRYPRVNRTPCVLLPSIRVYFLYFFCTPTIEEDHVEEPSAGSGATTSWVTRFWLFVTSICLAAWILKFGIFTIQVFFYFISSKSATRLENVTLSVNSSPWVRYACVSLRESFQLEKWTFEMY